MDSNPWAGGWAASSTRDIIDQHGTRQSQGIFNGGSRVDAQSVIWGFGEKDCGTRHTGNEEA